MITGIEKLGSNLQNLATEFCGDQDGKIEHVGGSGFILHRADGETLRMLADEGIGSIEGEDGFDEAWDAD